jgi:hypothetical protein
MLPCIPPVQTGAPGFPRSCTQDDAPDGICFSELSEMLLNHLDGILNYCRTKVPMGVVDAVNGNIKTLLGGGPGPQEPTYLLLKAQRMDATRTELSFSKKPPDSELCRIHRALKTSSGRRDSNPGLAMRSYAYLSQAIENYGKL